MCGVALRDMSEGAYRHAHVHAKRNGWIITSSHSISDMLTVTPLQRVLPGFLGTYLYPDDATFHMEGKETTLTTDLQSVIIQEQHRIEAQRKKLLSTRINHLTVHDQVESTFPDNGGEDEEGEDFHDDDLGEEDDVDEFEEEDEKQDDLWYEDNDEEEREKDEENREEEEKDE